MNTTVVCKGIRPATGNSKLCVVIASQDEREGAGAIDLTAASDLTEVREQLRAQGIVLGGPLQPAPRLSTQSGLASPIEIIAHNEHGKEHRLTVDHLEEYSLSSGSTLYYFYVPDTSCDCRWLVGRTLEVADFGNRQPDITWQEWFELCEQTAWPKAYGIYRLRITSHDGTPIPIARMGGVDPDGVIYIGRSGLRSAKSDRCLSQRLWEFWQGRNHSGAITYGLARLKMSEIRIFCEHRLWASVAELADEVIEQAEKDALRAYFDRFLELPPFNGAFPGRC